MENFRYMSKEELKNKMFIRKIIIIFISLIPVIFFSIITIFNPFVKINSFELVYLIPIIISIIFYLIGTFINYIAYKDYKIKEKSYLEGEKIKAELLKEVLDK